MLKQEFERVIKANLPTEKTYVMFKSKKHKFVPESPCYKLMWLIEYYEAKEGAMKYE